MLLLLLLLGVEETEAEAGKHHELTILSKNCDGGSVRQSFSNRGLKPLWPCRNILSVVFSTRWGCGGGIADVIVVVVVGVLGVDDGFIGWKLSWDCGGEVCEVVGGGLDIDSNSGGFFEVTVGLVDVVDGLLIARRKWLLERVDSFMRVEVVTVLISRFWPRVGVDADWGIESVGRSF